MKIKNLIPIIAAFTLSANFAFAQNNESLDLAIKEIQKDWAISKYKSKTKDEKIEGYQKCASKAEDLVKLYPNTASSLIWQGICLSSEAELTKLSALGKVKKAKKLFEEAIEIDEQALDGSAYTNLAVLHHRVPGWPIGFGDKEIAEKYFQKVLAISPNNIDANYFYALFLEDKGEDKLALKHLEIAAISPSRNRPLADSARKAEINKKIKEIRNNFKE